MNTNSLEFNIIIEKLKTHALSENAREVLSKLSPSLNEGKCIKLMAETTAARKILDACGSPPLPSMNGLSDALILTEAGGMLTPEQLTSIAQFAASCKRVASYLNRGESVDGLIAFYGRSLPDLTDLRLEIEKCVRGDSICDEASASLKDLRRRMENLEGNIKEKLSALLKSRKEYLSDNYYTTRGGRYVLPVLRQFKNQVSGTVVEVSGTGSTIFIEPSAVSKLQAEWSMLSIEEDSEVRRILYTLTSMVENHIGSIRLGMEAMEILDALFAKAKLSLEMKAGPAQIGTGRRVIIKQGRHPLLSPENCVPLDFIMDEGASGVIITGPNTGGKTVTVKTVGLLSLMAQCGLHIPCASGSYIAMHDGYFCDIGDSQDISQNLSTFSGHMSNIIRILESASCDSLVMLDELGSGTDPAEGMGIAIAVLEELKRRGCMFLVTTHYPQVKDWSENTEGVRSARMAFDKKSLQPLYLLEMGKAGESCALDIARRLGLAEHLLLRAQREVYGGHDKIETNPPAIAHPKSKLVRSEPVKETAGHGGFQMGDSVTLLPGGEIGIVYRPANEKGEVIVQVKGVKFMVKHTRLKLRVPAAELYPPDYDFSIIFDTVEQRKAHKKMGKHHDPDLILTYNEEIFK
ncbi:MAG: DNA mismatch repair protein MutS [Clostridiales bacterium]|jgi:dsDNA-specific endonuclease/ATPase MutS2|nr:DNA mismatch repair protein MutS [Clostridiales bacterium]